jgi:methionyl aminopeptidase
MDSPLQSILENLALVVHPGVSTMELEVAAAAMLRLHKVEPAFLGYKPEGAPGPYPNVLCVSINNEVIHGIPDANRKIEDGDVVSLDLGLKKLTDQPLTGGGLEKLNPWEFDDGALTVICGNGSSVARRLLVATKAALEAGVIAAKPGKTTHDIGRAIASVASHFNFGIVKGYGGHGIGHALHLPPHIPNEPLGEPLVLEAGKRYAIEPMFSSKKGDVHTEKNGWTVKLNGGGIAAHFERTIQL